MPSSTRHGLPSGTAGTARAIVIMAATLAGIVVLALLGGPLPATATDSTSPSATQERGAVTLRLKNGSFETGTRHWRAARARARSVRSRGVPEGARQGQFRWHRGRTTRSVRHTGPVRGHVGDRFDARVEVAAGSRSAVGDTVSLVVTERVRGRLVERTAGEPVRLQRGYRTVTTTHDVSRSDTRIRVRIKQSGIRRGAELLVDNAMVDVTPTEEPTEEPTQEPTEEPTDEPTDEPTQEPTEEPVSSGTSLGLLSIREGQAPFWNDTSRYSYIVGYGWEFRRVAAVKAANPNTQMLLYLEAGATQYRDDCDSVSNPASFQEPRASWGVDFCWLQANGHDDWILRDAQGRYLEFKDYPGFLAMDMANPAFAAQWAQNAVRAVRTFGFDGVWADDVNTAIGHGHNIAYRKTPSGRVAIDNAQYGADSLEWVRRVHSNWDQLTQDDDLLLAANVYAVAWEQPGATQAIEMARHLDIYSREHQSQWLTGHQCDPKLAQEPNAINASMRFAEDIQATGASYVAIDYGTDPISFRDRQVMSFGRSMWLMTWDGSPGGAYFYRPCGFVDAADPAWTTELGTPTGPRKVLRTERFLRPGDQWESTAHLLRRDFTLGTVIQNQLPHEVTVPLDGRYRTPEGRVVESVTLPGSTPATSSSQGLPGTAALLTRVD